MSGEPALAILYPQPRQMTLAGQPVFVGKMKLRQKGELQYWLDHLPEPNPRVRAELDKAGVTGWPISYQEMPILMDVDIASRAQFLEVILKPFNPGMTLEKIGELADESTDDEEFVRIMLVAFGHDPDALHKRKAAPTDPKEEDAVRSFS